MGENGIIRAEFPRVWRHTKLSTLLCPHWAGALRKTILARPPLSDSVVYMSDVRSQVYSQAVQVGCAVQG